MIKQKYFYPAMSAGISLIIMTLAAFYSSGYVLSNLIVPGNEIGTLEQLIAAKELFVYGLIGWSIIVVTDLIVTWAFYMFLKNINLILSLIAATARFIYTVLLMLAVSKLLNINSLISNVTEVTPPLANEVMASLNAFENIWSLGLIVFGVHLFLVGYLALKSKSIPKMLSVLMIIAGIGYSIIHFMFNFLPQFDFYTNTIEMILMLPMIVGELGFGIWLLVKGRRLKEVI